MAHPHPIHWATFDDVVTRWVGPGAPTDEALVDALILDAEAVILSKFPSIQDRITSGALSLDVVTMVVCRQVSRMLRNPESLTYLQQNTGPFGSGKNYGSSGNVDIFLTDDELSMLSVSRGRKAFSIDTAPNAVSWATDSLLTGNGYEESI